jgi:pimeloyl-ACP methyl ester carboxylesterase
MPERTLIFLPGFMAAPSAYSALLTPVMMAGWHVIVPQLYPRGLPALLGKYSVRDEAAAAAALVSGRCVIGGHSRGGQAAWLAAGMSDVAGVVLVDPVDGQGRRPSGPVSTAQPAGFSAPCLVIGAGKGGRCAPAEVNYEHFTAATPTATEVVIPELGHADVLEGRAGAFGRRVCGGAADPTAARRHVAELILGFVNDAT